MAGLTATDQISTSSASLSASTSEAFVARRRPEPGAAATGWRRLTPRRSVADALAKGDELRSGFNRVVLVTYPQLFIAGERVFIERVSTMEATRDALQLHIRPQSPSVVSATPTMLPVYAMEKWGVPGPQNRATFWLGEYVR